MPVLADTFDDAWHRRARLADDRHFGPVAVAARRELLRSIGQRKMRRSDHLLGGDLAPGDRTCSLRALCQVLAEWCELSDDRVAKTHLAFAAAELPGATGRVNLNDGLRTGERLVHGEDIANLRAPRVAQLQLQRVGKRALELLFDDLGL